MTVIDDHLDADTSTSLPRSNGELVFEEPWESRAFGMAAALADSGVFEWKDFQAGLIAAIAEFESDTNREQQAYCYYERWLTTLEGLIAERGLISTDDIETRITEYRCRPAGHDHHHDHSH